jgi:hypothetical protein
MAPAPGGSASGANTRSKTLMGWGTQKDFRSTLPAWSRCGAVAGTNRAAITRQYVLAGFKRRLLARPVSYSGVTWAITVETGGSWRHSLIGASNVVATRNYDDGGGDRTISGAFSSLQSGL